ncbi:MAG: TonB-dependent receptor [Bacteroidetes Order II. Incertae sedis bacterium]|nr:TonB-dependent receptor [Bacteroidetes Order II. bacterium]MBT5249982.1 TonB-dependent receptor [Bacteroidetes Order II. bacterium]MBT6580756.1 TonB-dependent receptor [Bacteroidetes Order II. bacterium]
MTRSISYLHKAAIALALIATVFISTELASAQSAGGPNVLNMGQVSGTILEAGSGDALFSATVAVWSLPDSVLVTGATTDMKGSFEIDRLDPGQYIIKVSFVGFQTWTTQSFTISESNRVINLGTVSLAFDSEQMGGVEVTAERADVAFEIDRTVYNTKSQISSAGGNATDVLQNVPSIEVDVDGNVSLRGNQNVGILINGKPSPLKGQFLTTFLQQLPASSIDRVEVIPNPSAKYDPEGQAGAINIVLKKEAEFGTSGGVVLGTGSDGGYNASGSYNLQKGNLKIFSSYGFRSDDRDSDGFNIRENRFLDPKDLIEQDNIGLRTGTSHLVNVSADYTLSSISEVTGSALLSMRDGNNESVNNYAQLSALRDLTSRSARSSLKASDGASFDVSLGLRRIPDAGKKEWTGDVRVNRSRGASADDLTEELLSLDGASALKLVEQTINELDNNDFEWTVQSDLIETVGNVKLETGIKSNFRTMDNSFDAANFNPASSGFVTDRDLSNQFEYGETVVAGYGIAGSKVGKFEAQAGVRFEQAMTQFDLKTTDESFENDYFSLFPSAFLNYNLARSKQLKLSYSKRVSRPRTSQLNPFTSFSDPLNLYVGNPSLNPEYIHAVELAYQQFSRKGSISLTPYYRRTVNKIERYKTLDEASGVSTLTFRNFDQSESYGAEVIGSIRLGQKFSGFSSFNAYRIVTEAGNVDADLANDAISWSARANVSWKVGSKTDLQMFYFYRAPIDVAQGKISSFSFSNVSLRQQILNGKGSLTFKVNDPLNTMGFEFELDQESFYQLGTRNWESRSASITFQYNFGKPPKRKARPRSDQQGGSGFDDVGIG